MGWQEREEEKNGSSLVFTALSLLRQSPHLSSSPSIFQNGDPKLKRELTDWVWTYALGLYFQLIINYLGYKEKAKLEFPCPFPNVTAGS